MEVANTSTQNRFWCIDFGTDMLTPHAATYLKRLFQKISSNVVFGSQRVFFDMNHSPWKRSFTAFQVKLQSLAAKQCLNPDLWQWGRGRNLADAWVRTRYQTASPEFLPIESIGDFLNPLEHRKVSASEGRRFRILRSLGVETLEDLSEIPEDVLLTQCGVWIAEFARSHFSEPSALRDSWLESTTAESLLKTDRPFHLEDWIPESYLAVG